MVIFCYLVFFIANLEREIKAIVVTPAKATTPRGYSMRDTFMVGKIRKKQKG